MNLSTRLPVAADWFSAEVAAEGITVLGEPHVHPLLQANIWLVAGRERDLLVDTGNGIGDLATALVSLREDPGKPLVAVLTHAHPDHQGGMHLFAERLMHRSEVAALERRLTALWQPPVPAA